MNRSILVSGNKTPLWVEILITVLGIAGMIFAASFMNEALPDAALDLKYSRQKITELTQSRLAGLGFEASDYQYSLWFSETRMASFFLQQTLGVRESNQKIRAEKLPIYSWGARWFKPQQKEEFYLNLSPQGDLVGFQHIIAEDAPGTNISQEQAQAQAEAFLGANTDWGQSRWERIEASSVTQPGGRVDHTFMWKSLDYSVGESELRYQVGIQGDRLGSLDYWIKTPEAYDREYAAKRDKAGFINFIAYLITMLVFGAVACVGAVMGKPNWRQAVIPALLVAGVGLASSLNYLPLYPASYDTTDDYTLFWLNNISGFVLGAVMMFFFILLIWTGGQRIAKWVWPGEDRVLPRGPRARIEFGRSAWRGIMVSGLHLGYVVLFYLLTSQYLGWWNPVGQGSSSNAYATPLPFLGALDVGISASVIEEVLARLVGISIVYWLTKRRWLALLIPGLAWAFAHTSYVSDPIYVRGIELTLVALFDGFLFWKFGLLTTLVAHFSYNALISSVSLLQSSDPYYLFSGIVVLLVVLSLPLPGLLAWLKTRNKPELDTLTLADATPEDVPALSGLPVKADWSALLADENRATLCLRAGQEMIGFATGYRTGEDKSVMDGVYVAPAWRKMYLGTKLAEALRERFLTSGPVELFSYVEHGDNDAKDYLTNMFWKSGATVLKHSGPPQVSELPGEFRKFWKSLRRKAGIDDDEMVIPQQREF